MCDRDTVCDVIQILVTTENVPNLGFEVGGELLKRELNKRLIYECRCDERLKPKVKEFTRLTIHRVVWGLLTSFRLYFSSINLVFIFRCWNT